MKEDGKTLAVYTEERHVWMNNNPQTFYITDHYLNYKYMLVRLEIVGPAVLQKVLEEAWKKRPLKK